MRKKIEEEDKIKYEYDEKRKENNLTKKQNELDKKKYRIPKHMGINVKGITDYHKVFSLASSLHN